MTEAEWLAAADPQPMLDFLRARGGASDRKLRLFAVAFCRRWWGDSLTVPQRAAVEVAERYADGAADERERREAGWWVRGSKEAELHRQAFDAAVASVYCERCVLKSVSDGVHHFRSPWGGELLRDLFGNPFRPTPSLAPAVLAGAAAPSPNSPRPSTTNVRSAASPSSRTRWRTPAAPTPPSSATAVGAGSTSAGAGWWTW